MGRENSLPLCSLEHQHFRACEQQRIPVGATAPVGAAVCAAVCGFTSAPVEKLFPSQESQAVLCCGGYLVVLSLAERSISSPPLLPGKPTQLVAVFAVL